MANVNRLIAVIIKLGTEYKPSNPSIMIGAFQNSCAACIKAIEAVGSAVLVFRAASKQRELAFAPLNKLATRIYKKVGILVLKVRNRLLQLRNLLLNKLYLPAHLIELSLNDETKKGEKYLFSCFSLLEPKKICGFQ